jgi:hypothetical protein
MPRTRSPLPALLAGLGAGFLALPASPADTPAEPAEVSVKAFKDRIEFRHGKQLAATYHIDPKAAKPYFWPLHSPSGVPVTRPWPMEPARGEAHDHPHQKSAWFCHGDVLPEGIPLKKKTRHASGVDFWSEEPGHGRIVCTRVGAVKRAKDHARVTTHNEWRTADGVKVLDETRTIHFHDFGTARLFVLDIDLHAGVCPITFGDTKEGSLGVRVRESLRVDRGKGQLVNAEGKTGEGAKNNARRDGCWGLVSAWCDYSGPAGGKVAGIALFADPHNPYPTAWHSRNYGLMAANPFGRAKAGFPATRGRKDLVKLAKGEHLKLRYGIFLHDGDAREGKVAHYYTRFTRLKTPDK